MSPASRTSFIIISLLFRSNPKNKVVFWKKEENNMSIWSALAKIFGAKDAKRNSIKIKSVHIDFPFELEAIGGIYTFKLDRKVDIIGTRRFPSENKEREFILHVTFKRGFKTDGASAPDIFTCLVPHFQEKNDLYNSAPFVHDGLYVWGGKVTGLDKKLSREECDDFLREIWGIAGMSRPIRGIADKGIEFVAGSKDHWGEQSDTLDCKYQFVTKWEYR